jgi:DNA-binding response OmpR family regulator
MAAPGAPASVARKRAMHILVVEDERRLARLLQRVLEEQQHVVELAYDGETGLELAGQGGFDLIIMDVMLPGKDGVSVTRELRSADVGSPVLMLTARDAVEDRVRGLDAGADDYLVKPFAFDELLARVRSLGRRRAEPLGAMQLRVGDLTLDLVRHEARRTGKLVELTAKEFALLEYLMRHAGQTVSRMQITDHVWRYDFDGETAIVDVYIHYLRNKVDRGFASPLIHTIRGVGYVLRE